MIVRPASPSTFSLLFSMRGSVVPVVWRRVLFTVGVAVLVTVVHGTLGPLKITLTPTPFSLIGLTLAIFLGFRNSVSYDRFWEARKLWGEVLVVTRNLGRQTLTLVDHLEAEEKKVLLYRLAAFAHVLRHQLRGSDPSADLARLLPAGECTAVLAQPNRPNMLLERIGAAYAALGRAGRVSPQLLANIDEQISLLSHAYGGCERIRHTPIPYAYILLLHRTVHLYCYLLPFGLVDSVGVMTPLVVGIVSYTFFGLDTLGDQIEDPFDTLPNDLPLNALCHTIESNLLMLLDEPLTTAPQPDASGVLL